jgi:hypothetical protein
MQLGINKLNNLKRSNLLRISDKYPGQQMPAFRWNSNIVWNWVLYAEYPLWNTSRDSVLSSKFIAKQILFSTNTINNMELVYSQWLSCGSSLGHQGPQMDMHRPASHRVLLRRTKHQQPNIWQCYKALVAEHQDYALVVWYNRLYLSIIFFSREDLWSNVCRCANSWFWLRVQHRRLQMKKAQTEGSNLGDENVHLWDYNMRRSTLE